MNRIFPILRGVGFIALVWLGFGLLWVLLEILSPFGGYDLLLLHFGAGFWFFMSENLPAMSSDAGTWALASERIC